MAKIIDLVGNKYGRLTVIKRGENTKQGQTTWVCLCECGNEKQFVSSNIRLGLSTSCGCFRKEKTRAYAKSKVTHGMTKTSEYRIWSGIMTRCFNKNDHNYPKYGGRGITVCSSWMKFENFLEDMGKRPSDKHSIDRIDVNSGYHKENCRWADLKTQCRNKRDTVYYTHNNETKPLIEWAEIVGIKYQVLWNRLKNSKVGGDLFRPITPLGKRTKRLTSGSS